jgi:hypothetical protein
MKTISSILAIAVITQTSLFAQKKSNTREDTFGLQMMEALKENNPTALINLFPSLEELHAVMDAHADLYSTTLQDAKADLSTTYENTVLATATAAFRDLLSEGKKRGIEWRNIKSMKIMNADDASHGDRIHLRFYSHETSFDLEVQKFTTANGQLKVTQFIKLI